jgi:hypothetical protein
VGRLRVGEGRAMVAHEPDEVPRVQRGGVCVLKLLLAWRKD